MYVCICNGITDSHIKEAYENGATSIECLQNKLGIASSCGQCKECAKQVLHEAYSSQLDSNR